MKGRSARAGPFCCLRGCRSERVSLPHVPLGYAGAMDDEWMFEALGAIGAQLEERAGGLPVLVYRFPPEQPAAGPAAEGFSVGESRDVEPGMSAADIADVVERRLSRHFTVERVNDAPVEGAIRVWALSERSASPGLDQPMT